MKSLISILILLFSASSLIAEDSQLRELDRSDEALIWSAVGRVNIGDHSFCTGTLIEVNIVLTAAHCFYNNLTGERLPDSEVRFVAGWNDGSAQSVRGARKVVIHEGYQSSTFVSDSMIANDVALIELDQAILSSSIAPLSVGRRPKVNSDVKIVSYGSGRAEVPSIQDACEVFQFSNSVLTLSCDVTFGSSGSPVIRVVDEQPQVVSVISSMRVGQGRKLAYAMDIDRPLHQLRQRVTIGQPSRKTSGSANRRPLSEQLGRNDAGGRSALPQISN